MGFSNVTEPEGGFKILVNSEKECSCCLMGGEPPIDQHSILWIRPDGGNMLDPFMIHDFVISIPPASSSIL